MSFTLSDYRWELRLVFSRCISPRGCTCGHSRSLRRCRQSCRGKRQPGSYRLEAQGGGVSPAVKHDRWHQPCLMFYLESTWCWKWSRFHRCASKPDPECRRPAPTICNTHKAVSSNCYFLCPNSSYLHSVKRKREHMVFGHNLLFSSIYLFSLYETLKPKLVMLEQWKDWGLVVFRFCWVWMKIVVFISIVG